MVERANLRKKYAARIFFVPLIFNSLFIYGSLLHANTVKVEHSLRLEPSQLSRDHIRELIYNNKNSNKFMIEEPVLDLGKVSDPCVEDRRCLLSQRVLSPTEADLKKPVILLSHGLTATTFEWSDFERYLALFQSHTLLRSMILLGGHGRSTEAFRETTWTDWGKPILRSMRLL